MRLDAARESVSNTLPDRGARWLVTAGVTLALAFATSNVTARDIHYGAVEDAGVLRCDNQQWRGQQDQARTCYLGLANAADPAVRAEALWALGDLKSANQIFQQGVNSQPRNARLKSRWAALFTETHQEQDALNLYREALQADENDAYARVGVATILAQRFEAEAAEFLAPVLDDAAAPAGARLKALLLRTHLALENGDIVRAEDLLEQAEGIAGQLPKVEIYAYRVALENARGNDGAPWTARALQENARYGDVYAIPAYFYMITRRLREAISLYEKAVQTQPDHWAARVELGSNLLRDNQITVARQHLEAAYKGDPYNPRTVNTLRLLDSLSNFDLKVYPEPTLPVQGGAAQAELAQPRLMMRLHKKESAVLVRYVQRLADESIRTFAQRYGFEPTEPVVIEMYPDHEDFAVRTAGMPGLGLLGATFGNLLAMDSPSARPVNEFHWASTLWHEMAHVITLGATEHRVPRWFSEGVSVFEEWRTGPIKGIIIPGYVFEAFAADKMLPLADLDEGFIRPEYPEQVMVSYMQAGLVCEFIDREFGPDKLKALLTNFRRGEDTAKALQAVLGTPMATLDERFQAFVKREFSTVFANLPAWQEARKTANDAAGRSDWDAVIPAGRRAVEIWPGDVEDGSPYVPLARAYLQTNQRDQALATLETYWRRGGHDPGALRALADRFYELGRKPDAVAVMQSINYVAPYDYQQHSDMGDWLMELGRSQEALDEFEVTLALNAPDKAGTHYRLAQAHHALKRPQEARRHVLAALEVAPNYRPAQRLLLEISRPN